MRKPLFILFVSTAVAMLGSQPSIAQDTSPYWSSSGNSNASVSSKLGTTNAIPLRLFTNNATRMYIGSTGNVGIGTSSPSQKLHVAGNTFISGKLGINTTPSYPLDIKNTKYQNGLRVVNSYSSEENRIGVSASSFGLGKAYGVGVSAQGGWIGTDSYGGEIGVYGDGGAVGVYGHSSGLFENNIGVLGQAYANFSPLGNYYGVYGHADFGEFNAAGYFDGDVWAGDYYTISDKKFKTAITPLTRSLEQLMKLKPSAYEFKTSEYAKMGLPKGRQIGLIADEVKQVFPELVKPGVHPALYSKDKKTVESPEVKYEGVNYQGLIPVVIASVQEQQQILVGLEAENEALKEQLQQQQQQIDELKEVVGKLVKGQSEQWGTPTSVHLSSAYLEQNSPNPFQASTIIRYHVPANTSNAKVEITDMKGAVLKNISLNSKGNGQITINSNALAVGTYTYSLWVDGKLADVKQMVVNR